MIVHAGLIAARIGEGAGCRWAGVLIEGASGAGKSDLALRALDAGFHLVADDRVLLWTDGRDLYGRAPDTLAGLIEVRGVGVRRIQARLFAPIVLRVAPGVEERVPDPARETLLGVALPRLLMDFAAASAPTRLRCAITAFDAAHKRRI